MTDEQPDFIQQVGALIERLNKALTPERLLRDAVEEYNRRMAEFGAREPR